MSDLNAHLLTLLQDIAAPLPEAAPKRMFGCDTFFASGTIFAMVWKEGRIAVKLPDPATYNELLAQPGTDKWAPGGKVMGRWLLVPETWHDELPQLASWVRQAHAQALAAIPKPKAKKKGSA